MDGIKSNGWRAIKYNSATSRLDLFLKPSVSNSCYNILQVLGI